MKKSIPLYVVFALTLMANASQASVIYEETFNRNTAGPIQLNRNISAMAGPALVVFSNGGLSDPKPLDMVAGGSIEINGETIFGSLDFKILGSVTKKIPLIDGTNYLFVAMKGKLGGKFTIQIFQGEDRPTVTFPLGTIFVSTSSPDASDTSTCGLNPFPTSSTTGPCRTINHGLDRAKQTAAPQVAVGWGIYVENIALVNGIPVLGGYDPEFTRRDLTSLRSIIKGDGVSPATVTATDISLSTLFEGFIVEGPSATLSTPNGNSIGLYIKDSTAALIVRNNTLFAGVGADGARGSNGTNGQNGNAGMNGHNGIEYTGTSPGSIPGGAGGSSTTASGGPGGTSIPPVASVQQAPGCIGSGSGAGVGGIGGYNWEWNSSCTALFTYGNSMLGLNGLNGSSGSYGFGGVGGDLGSILPTGIWVSEVGGNGANGVNGAGGGGGGAAGGVAKNSCTNGLVGSSGGGGGAAGQAGLGGTGGGGGGSAFGVFVYNSDISQIPNISANDIHLGIAGNGGDGGFGGRGGVGGQGGFGGTVLYVIGSSIAGNGGRGGEGGHGGGGGGGAGGISVGIFTNFAGSYETINTIQTSTGRFGLGGNGGLSLGLLGVNGTDGEVLPTLYVQ
jgi:hypothetical protein